MIIVVCIAAGLAARVLVRRPIAALSEANLKGEMGLLVLLVAQIVAPLLHLSGPVARIAFWVWLGSFPCMAVIAWANRRAPGLALMGAGLLLNFGVIAANAGMPVFAAAAAAARGGPQSVVISATDFVHVLGMASTRLPWLADVIPLPGPAWLRAVVSVGDCLLFVGVASFVALAEGPPKGVPRRE